MGRVELFQQVKRLLKLFAVGFTLMVCTHSAHLIPGAYSQSSIRQGTADDLRHPSDPNVFVSPMVLSQSLKDFCKGEPIDKDGIWISFAYNSYICENVSLKQLDFGLRKKAGWHTPRLSIWASLFTREPRDKLVDLWLDFYSGNKKLCSFKFKDIDAEEGKETVAEKEVDCPVGLFDCEDEPGVVITISVKDNG